MESLANIFCKYSTIGFSGSRSSVPAGCSHAAALVPASASILVGCAPGVDEFFRGAFPSASIFSASSYGEGRSSFARRSIAVISTVAADSGLWVSFPASECPIGLFPSYSSNKCFSGFGSGSWASLAYALGCGLSCLVFLDGIHCPRGWDLSPVYKCPGWFFCGSLVTQLSLFN
jgi:hypothetical protein